MGILLFKDKEYRYGGFNDGKHRFENLSGDTITFTREAKLHLVDTPVTLYCKSDGEVEPTYQTRRCLTANQISEFISSHGINISQITKV